MMTRVDIAAALKITSLFLMTNPATAAKRPTPQARKSIDSYILEAGIRPAAIHRMERPQVITAKPVIRRIEVRRFRQWVLFPSPP